VTEQLTGYEASSVAEIGAILDASPATADDVYLDTMNYSERAIAAVAAKRAGGGGGGASIYARVQLSPGTISDWDWAAIPFNSVTTDADALWDAANHQFVAQSAGWYRLTLYGSGTGGGVNISSPGAGEYKMQVQTSGIGDSIQNNVVIGDGEDAEFPPLVGETYLDISDGIYVLGDGGTGWFVPSGFTFAIELVVAD